MRFITIAFTMLLLGAANGCTSYPEPREPQDCPEETDEDHEGALALPHPHAGPRAETGYTSMTQASRSTADGSSPAPWARHDDSLAVREACLDD